MNTNQKIQESGKLANDGIRPEKREVSGSKVSHFTHEASSSPKKTRTLIPAVSVPRFLHGEGIVEIRIPGKRSYYVDVNDEARIMEIISEWDGVANLYLNLNPTTIEPTKPVRDIHVDRYRWLFIDVDTVRDEDAPATDEQRTESKQVAKEKIIPFLSELGFLEPTACSSGNGTHLLYRIDLENNKESRDLIKRDLKAIDWMFGSESIIIDVAVANASRMIRVYGARNLKGGRRTAVLKVGSDKPTPVASLRKLAALLPDVTVQTTKGYNPPWDVRTWLEKNIGIKKEKAYEGGTLYELKACPLNPAHDRGEAWVIAYPDGGMAAGCHHASCNWGWSDLVGRYEPERVTSWVKEYNNTQLGNSERLTRIANDRLRWCQQFGKGSWLIWNGMFWEVDLQYEIYNICKELIAILHDEAARTGDKALEKWALQTETHAQISAMMKLVKSNLSIHIDAFDASDQKYFLNCKSGVVDLRTGDLHPHDPKRLITRFAPVAYELDATLKLFDYFLESTFSYDNDLLSYIQRSVGHSATGDRSEESLWLCYGLGRNGKSKFLDLILRTLGTYGDVINFSSFTQQTGSNANNDHAALRAVRFLTSSESERRAPISEATLKKLISEMFIKVRFLFGEFFTLQLQMHPWVATNYRPDTKGQDDGLWERMKLIPFERSFPRGNKSTVARIDERIFEKCPEAVLAWIVKGAVDWCENGLVIPRVVKEATADYREEQDPLASYFNAVCEANPKAWTAFSDLYETYKSWCGTMEYKPWSEKKFSQQLAEHSWLKRCPNNKGDRGFRGIELKVTGKDADPETTIGMTDSFDGLQD